MTSLTLREAIAKAIFEEPTKDGNIRPWRHWCDLACHHREGWMRDADRVIAALSNCPEIPDSSLLALIAWAEEAARYFENRPTGGEDKAHWANVYNAENARRVADALRAVVKDSLTGAA